MVDYAFITLWRLEAPQQKVWDLIFHSEQWPEWWPGVERVEKLRDVDANHVGARHRYTDRAEFYQLPAPDFRVSDQRTSGNVRLQSL